MTGRLGCPIWWVGMCWELAVSRGTVYALKVGACLLGCKTDLPESTLHTHITHISLSTCFTATCSCRERINHACVRSMLPCCSQHCTCNCLFTHRTRSSCSWLTLLLAWSTSTQGVSSMGELIEGQQQYLRNSCYHVSHPDIEFDWLENTPQLLKQNSCA
jgi:hypothetical protein